MPEPPPAGLLCAPELPDDGTPGACTDGVLADGVETGGVLADGVETLVPGAVTEGTVVDGTVTLGTVTDGTLTVGAETDGVDGVPPGRLSEGVLTAGVAGTGSVAACPVWPSTDTMPSTIGMSGMPRLKTPGPIKDCLTQNKAF